MDRKTFFNEMASSWDDRFYTNELKERLNRLVSLFNIKSGEKILDVGSGTGGIVPYLIDLSGPNGMIEAIDYAEGMVKIAKEKFANEKRVRFHVCSIEDLPFEDNFFDRVICFGVFPHIDEKERALNEIYRVLKKEAYLIIAHALSSEEINDHHRKAEPVKDDRLPDETNMRKLITDSGFYVLGIIDEPGCYLCQGIKKG